MESKQPKGMFAFTIVWVGQAISLLGTAMSAFALTIWAYQLTGKATALALAGFFYVTPMLIISPIAGAIVDRSNRKLMMMLSDLASGLATIGIFILYSTGHMQIWHLYIANMITGTFQTFQWPAYSAAITMIVPKKHYARASAMNELAGNSSGIFAPILAGALLPFIGLQGILSIDIISFLAAIGALLVVHIPQPEKTEEGIKSQGSIWKESIYGFKYILDRPSLLGLQLVFLVGNFFAVIAGTLLAPMILANTGSNALVFGSVETAGAIGGLTGGLIMSAWGGPKRKTNGVLSGWSLSGLLGPVIIGLGRGLPLWAAGNFMAAFMVPLVNSSNQAIWQAKVAPDIQGRVFATRRLIAWFVTPLATLIAGPLADFVFGPAMMGQSFLAHTFGQLIGTGAGRGMSLMIFLCGIAMALVGVVGYRIRSVREAESLLPDHAVAAEGYLERQAELERLLARRQELITESNNPDQERALKEITAQLRELGKQQT